MPAYSLYRACSSEAIAAVCFFHVVSKVEEQHELQQEAELCSRPTEFNLGGSPRLCIGHLMFRRRRSAIALKDASGCVNCGATEFQCPVVLLWKVEPGKCLLSANFKLSCGRRGKSFVDRWDDSLIHEDRIEP